MSAAVCYFLVYFAEALILLQYSSNVFENKISSIKRYILLTVLFIPIYFISRRLPSQNLHNFIKH